MLLRAGSTFISYRGTFVVSLGWAQFASWGLLVIMAMVLADVVNMPTCVIIYFRDIKSIQVLSGGVLVYADSADTTYVLRHCLATTE